MYSYAVSFAIADPYAICGIGTPVCFADSQATGIVNAMMMMMYCAI